MSSTSSSEIITSKQDGIGTIILNRPKALNALTVGMVRALDAVFHTWEDDPDVKLYIMKGAGGKAFCAGGDVVGVRKAVIDHGAAHGQAGHEAADFFREEYQVNYAVFTSKKIQVSLWDGFVMGGGVGLSIGSQFRIATEKTVFAMPETAIGLFPDVGGTYWLPRLPGGLGPYIGLTGVRMNASDLLYSGIATHYVPSARLPELEAALGHLGQSLLEGSKRNQTSQLASSAADAQQVHDVIKGYVEDPPTVEEAAKGASLVRYRQVIDEVFGEGVNEVEEIVRRLESSSSSGGGGGGDNAEWVAKTLKAIKKVSPTSLKVTLQALRRGKTMSLEETFPMEYRLSQACMSPESDFIEGVRALLVDKDNQPKWHPSTLAEVTSEMVDRHFAPLPPDCELRL